MAEQYSEAVQALVKELVGAKKAVMSAAYDAGQVIDKAIVEIRCAEDRLCRTDLDKRAALEYIEELEKDQRATNRLAADVTAGIN